MPKPAETKPFAYRGYAIWFCVLDIWGMLLLFFSGIWSPSTGFRISYAIENDPEITMAFLLFSVSGLVALIGLRFQKNKLAFWAALLPFVALLMLIGLGLLLMLTAPIFR